MSFTYDSRGVQPSSFEGPIPEGEYEVTIKSAEPSQSKRGDPMVKIQCVVSHGPHKGAFLYHYVTFLPAGSPGAGIAMHFLKSIGEPYEELESLEINPDNWIDKGFSARVIQEEYKRPDGSSVMTNKIKGIEPSGEIPF